MSLTRQPVLSESAEAILREELSDLWARGLSGLEIAKELSFGVSGHPYEDLDNPNSVYFYRNKFKLPPRIKRLNKRGKPRYNVLPQDMPQIPLEEYHRRVVKKYPIRKNREGIVLQEDAMIRCLMMVYKLSPIRNSEALRLYFNDVKINNSEKTISLFYFVGKKGKKKSKKYKIIKHEFQIPMEFTGTEEIINYLKLIEEKYPNQNVQLFPGITRQRSLRFMKAIDPALYVHYHRFSHITSLARLKLTADEIKSEVNISYPTIDRYLMATEGAKRRALDKRREGMYAVENQ